MQNILIIDDDKDLCFLLKRYLNDQGFFCHVAHLKEKAFEILTNNQIDLVLCDLNLRKEDGRSILIAIKEEMPLLPVMIITGQNNVRTAVEVMKLGAEDYLIKPLIPGELALLINRRLSEAMEKVQIDQLAATPIHAFDRHEEQPYVLSPNKAFQDIIGQIDLVAPTDYSVIISGESGSGKEAFAQEIHKRSKRSAKPFMAIDCGALSKELSGSILFGHEKGAFTGAVNQKKGAFEVAAGGTVFLDEIGNLPYEIQVSLLRVMQERKIRRVGGTVDIAIDIRIIVASNRKLWDETKGGQFREDLYHRLNEFAIDVPPLRERKNDIIFYAQHFLNASNAELNRKTKGFTEEALNAMVEYRWPGNLRELRNLVKRSVLLSQSDKIGLEILPGDFLGADIPAEQKEKSSLAPAPSPETSTQDDYLKIITAFQQMGFNRRKTAVLLKMDRKTLNEKIKEFSDWK